MFVKNAISGEQSHSVSTSWQMVELGLSVLQYNLSALCC